MDLRVKIQQNGRNNIFIDKQKRNKAPLMFLHVNLLTLDTNWQWKVFVFSFLKNQNKAVKKVNSDEKAKSKVRVMFFDVTMQ